MKCIIKTNISFYTILWAVYTVNMNNKITNKAKSRLNEWIIVELYHLVTSPLRELHSAAELAKNQRGHNPDFPEIIFPLIY